VGIPLVSKLRTRLPETTEGKLQNILAAWVCSLLERNSLRDVASQLEVRSDGFWVGIPGGKYSEVLQVI
jgi:hypothetical protein